MEFYFREGRGADTVVNVTTIDFRFRDAVLVENFVFDETYEKVSVTRSHFSAHGYTVGLFVQTITECKHFVPIAKTAVKFSVKQNVKFLRRVQLKAF